MDWIRSARKSVWRDKRRSILHLQTRRDEGQQRRVKESPVGLEQLKEIITLGSQMINYFKKYLFGKEKSRKNVRVY